MSKNKRILEVLESVKINKKPTKSQRFLGHILKMDQLQKIKKKSRKSQEIEAYI